MAQIRCQWAEGCQYGTGEGGHEDDVARAPALGGHASHQWRHWVTPEIWSQDQRLLLGWPVERCTSRDLLKIKVHYVQRKYMHSVCKTFVRVPFNIKKRKKDIFSLKVN